MKYSEFRNFIQKWRFKTYGKLFVNIQSLEIYHYPSDKRIKLVKDPRSYFRNGRWHIYPIALSNTQVYIVCPYCGMIHLHGATAGEYESFSKVPHCHTSEQNYEIKKILD